MNRVAHFFCVIVCCGLLGAADKPLQQALTVDMLPERFAQAAKQISFNATLTGKDCWDDLPEGEESFCNFKIRTPDNKEVSSLAATFDKIGGPINRVIFSDFALLEFEYPLQAVAILSVVDPSLSPDQRRTIIEKTYANAVATPNRAHETRINGLDYIAKREGPHIRLEIQRADR